MKRLSAAAEWVQQSRTGLLRLWLLIGAIWIMASVVLVPQHYQTPYVQGNADNFDEMRPMCIRDTIEVTNMVEKFSEIPEGSPLKYGPVDYLASLRGHSFTPQEVQRRAEAIAASQAFRRAWTPYEAALDQYVSGKLKRALDRWERDRAKAAVLNQRFNEPMPTRSDFVRPTWPSSIVEPERPVAPIRPELRCISIEMTTKNLVYRALWALGPVFLVPLAVALSLALLWLALTLTAGTFRWVAAGFRPSVPSGQHNPNPEAQVATQQPMALPEPTKKPYRQKSVILGMLAALMAAFVAVTLSSVTKQAFRGDGTLDSSASTKAGSSASSPPTKTLRRVEEELRKHLPVQVSPGVTATNVQLHDRGMRWSYQVDSQLFGNDPTDWFKEYGLALRHQACQNQAVLEILTNGFEVSYEIRSTGGQQLGTVTVSECA